MCAYWSRCGGSYSIFSGQWTSGGTDSCINLSWQEWSKYNMFHPLGVPSLLFIFTQDSSWVLLFVGAVPFVVHFVPIQDYGVTLGAGIFLSSVLEWLRLLIFAKKQIWLIEDHLGWQG